MEKIIIYQVLPRLYGNRNEKRRKGGSFAENGCGKLADFTKSDLAKIRDLGVTHIWFTGVLRHATQTDYTAYGIPAQHPAVVKGKAGSPYAIADYYDIDPDLARNVDRRMSEFDALVRRAHNAGLKVITDFVPNHVARQYQSVARPEGVADLGAGDNPDHGFDPQNNFYYCPGQAFQPSFDLYAGQPEAYHEMPAKATGNDHFDPWPGVNDWYETVKLNYGVDYYAGRTGHFNPVPDTWKKMLHIVLFWAARGIDGMRCDMAEMVPAEFWTWMTRQVKEKHPGFIFIGEVYNPALYHQYLDAGFDYLYDKVGMYDTMRGVITHQRPASDITAAWQAVDDIQDHMLYFLENHDEQRLASDFFAGDGRKGIPGLVVSALLNTNPFMVYNGEEYGERGMDEEGFSGRDGRTTIFDYWCVGTVCRATKGRLTDDEKALCALYQKVLSTALREKTVTDGKAFDLMYANPASDGFDPARHYAFLRKQGRELLLVVANFADADSSVRVNLPLHAFDYLSIDYRHNIKATDLLTGDVSVIDLTPGIPVAMTVPARGARIWKITL